jgi:prepilin-type N-terminal cleavage/methylation domain-containing protein
MEEKGFTLIEMAIVLVIIGILMGAILRGQELIKNAKEKRFFSKLQLIASAQFTYLDRMSRYAGDTTSPPDGIIDDDTTAWSELEQQQLVHQNDKIHVFNGKFSFQGGRSPYTNYNCIISTRVPAWVAQSIDAKIDDSVATTGSVRWAGGDYGSVTDVNNANTMYWWFDR